MQNSIISKYLAWQRQICEKVFSQKKDEQAKPASAESPKPEVADAVEAVKAEPVTAEVAKPEAVKAEPVTAEVAKPEVVKAEAVTAEVAKPEVVKAEPVTAEVAKPEVVKAETETPSQAKPEPEQPQAETEPNPPQATVEVVSDDELAQGTTEVKELGSWQPPEPVRLNPSDTIFQDFTLDNRIMRAILEDLHFTACTPIQALTLPHALAGADIAGKAQTGTGKTATFLITMLQKFLTTKQDDREPNQPFALALAPTRELAIQIAHDANSLCAYCHFKTVAVYGGMDYEKQRRLLNSNVDFVVATPGRLIDFLQQHSLDLSRVQVLIIDEADRMLDMGFIPDVKRIVYRLKGPETRQTMLFSATLNHDILRLAEQWMRPNPVTLEVEPEHILAEGIQETIYAVKSEEKMAVLLWTFAHEDCKRVLIFRNRRDEVEALHAELQRYGIASEMLSGDVDQKKRLRILEDFKIGKVTVIVATDVAGRGIHVDDITHVINYDFPYEAEDYVHRVGRTARAGHTGRAISFADESSAFTIPDIEKFIGRDLPITQPTDEMLQLPEAFKDVRPARQLVHSRKPFNGNHHGGGPRRGGRFHK